MTVVIMIIPQAMAYSVLAGFPAVYGLYTCLIPLVLYPFFGSSPYLSVGPVAIISVLLAAGLCRIAVPMTQEYIILGLFVAFLAGCVQLLLAMFRLGSLSNFLSNPVLSGFISAAAIIIIASQLDELLGIKVERSSSIFGLFRNLFSHIQDSQLVSTIVGVASIILILLIKKIKRSLPAAMIVVIVMSAVVYFFELDVLLVGSIPAGLPSLVWPVVMDADVFIKVIPLAVVIGLVSFVESMAIAKSLGSKHGVYTISANQELLALGITKVAGAFFQAIPNTASFTRSAINESAGAQTGWSSIFAALIVGGSLMLFTGLFSYIPYPVLAAIVIAAVYKLIDYKEIKHLFSHDKSDFGVLVFTLGMTLLAGVQTGIISGIILSIIMLLREVATPHIAVLGKIDDTGIYKNIERFDDAEVQDEVLIVRYDDDIFFGNAEHFFQTIKKELSLRPNTIYLILDLSSVNHIDSTGIKKFHQLIDNLHNHKIEIHLSGAKGPLRDRLRKEGIIEILGADHQNMTIEKSMEQIRYSEGHEA